MKFLKSAAPVALVTGWFLFLIRSAFHERFNVDDITNLCIAWLHGYADLVKGSVLFWTGAIRPLGGLFYVVIYQFAGFYNVPFRIAAIALLVANLALLYLVLRRLTPSFWLAILALVLACYNGDMAEMYTSTGTVYDTLSLTFTLLALLCVMRERPRWILAALCTIAAVDSKEMGVSLPAIILAYELLIRPKPRFAAVISTGIVSLVFLLSRLAVKNSLSDMPAYQLTITGHRYLETTRIYLNNVLFHGKLTDAVAVTVLLVALGVALALRNRLMLFAWLYYVIAVAPMSFATPRSGYAIYVPYPGAALYVAALIFDLAYRLPQRARISVVALAIFVGAYYQNRQARFLARHDLGHPGGESTVQAVADGIGALAPTMPKGAHLLLINNPFEDDAELPHSTLRLRYRDPDLSVTRLTWTKGPGEIPYPTEDFDHVFLFTGENVWEMPRSKRDLSAALGPRSFVSMNLKSADLSIVKDIGAQGDPQRWANQDPELILRVPKLPAHFEMTYTVPADILAQTKTLDIDAWIAGQPAPPIHIAKPSDFTYKAPLPGKLKTGEVVAVRFHVQNCYVAKGDGAKLSFLLTTAGFLPD